MMFARTMEREEWRSSTFHPVIAGGCKPTRQSSLGLNPDCSGIPSQEHSEVDVSQVFRKRSVQALCYQYPGVSGSHRNEYP